MEHVAENRLRLAANRDVRLLAQELDHLEKCSECLKAFSRTILQSARTAAKRKSQLKTISRAE